MLRHIVINTVFENIQILIDKGHPCSYSLCFRKIKAEFMIDLAFIIFCKRFCFALKKNVLGRSLHHIYALPVCLETWQLAFGRTQSTASCTRRRKSVRKFSGRCEASDLTVWHGFFCVQTCQRNTRGSDL